MPPFCRGTEHLETNKTKAYLFDKKRHIQDIQRYKINKIQDQMKILIFIQSRPQRHKEKLSNQEKNQGKEACLGNLPGRALRFPGRIRSRTGELSRGSHQRPPQWKRNGEKTELETSFGSEEKGKKKLWKSRKTQGSAEQSQQRRERGGRFCGIGCWRCKKPFPPVEKMFLLVSLTRRTLIHDFKEFDPFSKRDCPQGLRRGRTLVGCWKSGSRQGLSILRE